MLFLIIIVPIINLNLEKGLLAVFNTHTKSEENEVFMTRLVIVKRGELKSDFFVTLMTNKTINAVTHVL